MQLKSWNRFLTRGLSVCPELMGQRHSFQFDNADVEVRLPRVEMADRDGKFDEVAAVGTRWAKDNRPINYRIYKVDVVVSLGRSVDLDPAVLDIPPNAFDLVPDAQQVLLETEAVAHGLIAGGAVHYWLSILKWVVDDYRIGRNEMLDSATGWGTYLTEAETETRVWGGTQTFHAEGFRTITFDAWNDAQTKMHQNSAVPVHLALKYEAEEFLAHGDARRCLIDTCIACETYLRQTVLATLPATIGTQVRRFVDDGNISQYVNHFFPSLLVGDAKIRYTKSIKEEITSLIAKRNRIMHSGDATGATRANCVRFLGVARELFSLPAQGAVSA